MRDAIQGHPIRAASVPTQVPVFRPKCLCCQFLSLVITLPAFPFKRDQKKFNPIGLKILNTLNLDGHFVSLPIFLGSRPNWIFKFPLKFFWGHRR